MWGFTFMQQPLTESPRIEQPSLWTCCQLLEEPWDFSLGSPSSVEWRLCTFRLSSSFKLWKNIWAEIPLTKTKNSSLDIFYLSFSQFKSLINFQFLYADNVYDDPSVYGWGLILWHLNDTILAVQSKGKLSSSAGRSWPPCPSSISWLSVIFLPTPTPLPHRAHNQSVIFSSTPPYPTPDYVILVRSLILSAP